MLKHYVVLATTVTLLAFTGGSLSAQQSQEGYTLQSDSLVLARVEGSNTFLAHSTRAGKWNSYSFPEGVSATPVVSHGACAFDLQGDAITEVVAVDQDGNWCSSRLPAVVKKCSAAVGDGVAVVLVDGKAHAFSAKLGKWDSVAAPVEPQISKDMVMIAAPGSIAVFSAATGTWAVAETAK